MAGESDVASGGDDLLDKTFKAGFVHIYLLGTQCLNKIASNEILSSYFSRVQVWPLF